MADQHLHPERRMSFSIFFTPRCCNDQFLDSAVNLTRIPNTCSIQFPHNCASLTPQVVFQSFHSIRSCVQEGALNCAIQVMFY